MANSGNTNGNEDSLLNEVHKKVSVLQELYIEFFATLIPGFVMTLSLLVLLFLFHFFAYDQLLFTEKLSKNLNPWIGFVSILVFSYTCGAILYRKDLKRLDRISSFFQWKNQVKNDRTKLAVQYPDNFDINIPQYETNQNATKLPGFNITATEYPYGYLRSYLVARGLYHLLFFVPWCYSCQKDNFRSKTIINALKTIIKSSNNGYYTVDLLRNEAHIRMMTSMWYVMRYLYVSTIILFSIGAVLRVALLIFQDKKTELAHVPCAIVVFGLLLAFFWWGKKSIEKSIHYVRIREIVTVLEQAYHIKTQKPNANFWDIIQLRHDEFSENNICDKCGINCVQKSKQIWETNNLDNFTQKIHIQCDCLSAVYTITNNFLKDIKS